MDADDFRRLGMERLPGNMSPRANQGEMVPSTPSPPLWPEERATVILDDKTDGLMRNLLHSLWTKAVGTPGYDKHEWQTLEMVLHRMHHKIYGELP